MTKAELIEQMATGAELSKSAASAALESMMEAIKATLKKKNGKIAISGFGTFSKVRRKARKGVNPKTGEKISIKARNAVKFQPAKALKDAV